MGLFDEPDELRSRKGRDEQLPRLRLTSPSYVKDTRAKAPQAILKVASFARGARVKSLISYIARTDKKEGLEKNQDDLEFETETGELKKGRKDVQELYDKWRGDFERKKPGAKREPRHATHIILHAKVPNDAKTAYRVNTAAREMLQKEFGARGYEYVFVTHRDKDNPHVHVVVKNYNRVLDQKLRHGKRELLEMRRTFASELQKQGIEHVATYKVDRPLPEREIKAHLTESKRHKHNWRVVQAAKAPGGEQALDERLRLARAIKYVRASVRAAVKPKTPQRYAAQRVLANLDDRLMKHLPADFRPEAVAVLDQLKKDIPALKRLPGFAEIETKVGGGEKKPSPLQRLQQRRAVERFADLYSKGVGAAIIEVRKNQELKPDDRRVMLTALQQQQKLMQGLGRGGMERGR